MPGRYQNIAPAQVGVRCQVLPVSQQFKFSRSREAAHHAVGRAGIALLAVGFFQGVDASGNCAEHHKRAAVRFYGLCDLAHEP